MSMSSIGAFSSASTALVLLRQSGSPAAESVGISVPGQALRYDGQESRGASGAAYTIDTILRSQINGARAPQPSSAAGLTQFQGAVDRFASAGVNFELMVDGAVVSNDIGGWLGDRNIGFIAEHASHYPATAEEALAQYGEIARQSAARPGSSDFTKAIYQAYLAGEVELIPAQEYGIRYNTTTTLNFSGSGDFMGGGIRTNTDPDGLTFSDLFQTRLIEQEDGSRIDIETGRYATGIYFGGQGFIVTFDRPSS